MQALRPVVSSGRGSLPCGALVCWPAQHWAYLFGLALPFILVAITHAQLIQDEFVQDPLIPRSEPNHGRDPAYTHPLMPGIVARQIWDVNWLRTQHDSLATGFSPLVCGMRQPPSVWGAVDIAAAPLGSVAVVAGPGDPHCILVNNGGLQLVNSGGEVIWSRPSVGSLIGSGDLHSRGGHHALFGAGPRLSLLDLDTGEQVWQHTFEPEFVHVKGKIADILTDLPGLEAAIFPTYSEEGCLINFPPDAAPQIVWQRQVVDGDYNERYDHYGSSIELDLSSPGEPVIWNVRHHRCRGCDARTGENLSTLTYDIGGSQRRNYGPMAVGRGSAGKLFACVLGESVQVHAHAIELHRDGANKLAWQHFYGEVYKHAPGVTIMSHGLADIDNDGADEIVYSVRDPALGFRSFVRVRSAETGAIKWELADRWGVGLFANVGPDQTAGLLALAAPDGQTPTSGELDVYCFDGSETPRRAGVLKGGGRWGPLTVAGDQGQELLLREQDDEGKPSLSRLIFSEGNLVRVGRTAAAELLVRPLLAVIESDQLATKVYLASNEGELRAHTWEGKQLWSLPLANSAPSAVSAADLDGDGKAELVAATSDQRLRVYSCQSDGSLRERFNVEHLIGWHSHHPAIYDLQGDGRLCLLAVGSSPDGKLVVRAYHGDGTSLWEKAIDATAADVRAVVINPGQFLGPNHAAVAVSILDSRRVFEGTYLLDGPTGALIWFKGIYQDGAISMPYRPNGIPTAYDIDNDGTEEIGMDMLSYMAFLRGSDGAFALIRPTRNLGTENAIYAGHLYNTYCPLFKHADDDKPHWLVTAGHGSLGLMNPDPRGGVWREELGYDMPRTVGLVDVDGDGVLEAGYVAMNDTKFICRDAWTGDVEWTVELPSVTNAATISADFDGDGRGEFFCGWYCLGVNADGQGEIQWRSPAYLGWPVIADFDGDGLGELADGQAGKIVILNTTP